MRGTGLSSGLADLAVISNAESRSISPENLTGERGGGGKAQSGSAGEASRDLGVGWKVNPYIVIEPGETFTLADIRDSGVIQQIWMTLTGTWRFSILRIYWDDQESPSVESPVGDFFATGWGQFAQLTSLPVCVNPGNAFNCYWQMPFRKRARVTLTNISDEPVTVFYQINYSLEDVPPEAAHFHAQFRRVNPLPYQETYPLLDGVRGAGHYVGTYIAWGANSNGWWGEGEIKFFLDDDAEYPTICGTGTEDYFGGSYCFLVPDPTGTQQYQEFTTPYSGFHQVIRPDGCYRSQMRFGMYRWHITDPVRFRSRIRITLQALGWRSGKRYLPLQDDIASVAFWYQSLPTAPFPALPPKDLVEII